MKWVPEIFPGVKRLQNEVNYLTPDTVEVKNKWIYTSTLIVCLRDPEGDSFTLPSIFFHVLGSFALRQRYLEHLLHSTFESTY